MGGKIEERHKPIAWGLLNMNTGKLYQGIYQSEESAKIGAVAKSHKWLQLRAVALVIIE